MKLFFLSFFVFFQSSIFWIVSAEHIQADFPQVNLKLSVDQNISLEAVQFKAACRFFGENKYEVYHPSILKTAQIGANELSVEPFRWRDGMKGYGFDYCSISLLIDYQILQHGEESPVYRSEIFLASSIPEKHSALFNFSSDAFNGKRTKRISKQEIEDIFNKLQGLKLDFASGVGLEASL